MSRIDFFGTPVDVMSMQESIANIDQAIQEDKFLQHVVVNVAKIVNMQNDPVLAESVRECDLINIDGMGVVWGARFLGHKVTERVAGIDLFMELIKLSEQKNYPVYLLGAKQEVLESLVEILKQRFPNLPLAGYNNGYFWDDEEAVVKDIQGSGAKLLFVAITSPKKENFINRWKDDLGVNFVMGVGGSFDVIAGKVKRAPKWMQEAGLEWFYRMIQEPRRMFKRYFTTNSKFAAMLLQAKFSSKK